MNAFFEFYLSFTKSKSLTVPMKPGNWSFHNGLTIRKVGITFTGGFRRLLAYAYIPGFTVFNGIQNILPGGQVAKLRTEDLLNKGQHTQLIFSKILS